MILNLSERRALRKNPYTCNIHFDETDIGTCHLSYMGNEMVAYCRETTFQQRRYFLNVFKGV